MAEQTDLKTLVTNTIAAVAKAQRQFDSEMGSSLLTSSETDGQAMRYAVPRTSVEMKFGLKSVEEKKLFLIGTKEQKEERYEHTLYYSIITIPEKPLSLASVTSQAQIEKNPFIIKEPHFIVSAEVEKDLYALLQNMLENHNYTALIPIKPEDIPDEIKAIRESIDNDRSANPKNIERGLVCFRLDGATESFLIVRVTDKNVNDSIFVIEQTTQPRLTIYSLEFDKVNKVQYKPFHKLALTIRRWVQGAPPRVTIHENGIPPNINSGLSDLKTFAANLNNDYVDSLNFIASQASITSPATFYDVVAVKATVSYSLEYKPKGAGTPDDGMPDTRFNIIGAKQEGSVNNTFILSHANLILEREDDFTAQTTIELVSPEFALSGAARHSVLENFENTGQPAFKNVLKAFNNEPRYQDFLLNSSLRNGVVILLSYRGNEPLNEFLIIWPCGMNEAGQQRDFVFIYKKEDNKVTKVLAEEESVEDTSLEITNDSTTDLSKDQYRAFHNFFHAVRIWRARSR